MVLFLFVAIPFSNVVYAENCERIFGLFDYPGGQVRYSLTVSMTQSLYDYYYNKRLASPSQDFAKLVTPYPVKTIADKLRELYSNDEIFADAVLGIAHQIPYEVSDETYPVETLWNNVGDCGGFSLLVASILRAGGLDVVLLEYTSKQHMNVGVYLAAKPTYARGGELYFVTYGNKQYYIAESTGDNFPKGWRVGECPTELRLVYPHVITLENCDNTQYGQVGASYKTLYPSQISVSASASFVIENSVITLSGVVSPSTAGNVTIYVSSFGGEWEVLSKIAIGSNGAYVYQWRPQSGGVYYLEASWSGNENYAGADSAVLTIWVIPFYGLVAGVLAVLLLILVIAYWLINRRAAAAPPEPPAESKPPIPPPAPEETRPIPQETQQPPQEPPPQPPQTSQETIQTQEQQPKTEEKPTTTEETASPPSSTDEPPASNEPASTPQSPQPPPTQPEETQPPEQSSTAEPPPETPNNQT
jgi:hypothetical protein